LFQESWKDLIIIGIQSRLLTKEQWKDSFKQNNILDISALQNN